MSETIDLWLKTLSQAMSNPWLAPVFALLAGILTAFTPCALSSIPLVIGYVSGGSKDTKRAFRLSLAFAAGSAVTFTVLGISASLLGRLMSGAGTWWYVVLGVLMILMALQTWEVYNFIPAVVLQGKNPKTGYIGAMLAGILGGFFSSPCATPVLIMLLSVVAKEGNLLQGAFLLLLYSVGHSVLVLIAGTSIGFVKGLMANQKYARWSGILRIFLGSLILLIALYLFYLGF